MLGRLLGGVATSLLFSVFEAWLIRSHSDAKLKHWLGRSFSCAAYGNSVIAIVAGLVANKAASSSTMSPLSNNKLVYSGGYLNPFDIAWTCLLVCAAACYTTWDENYGPSEVAVSSSSSEHHDHAADKPNHQKWYDGLRNAFLTTTRNPDILLCGLISSLFEGSMYIFVFMWTPALTEREVGDLPFGLIFATFMVSCMAGSSIFSFQSETIKGELLAMIVFGVASFAMGMVAMSSSNTAKFFSMNLFEICVGMYFPVMGILKGTIVPESKRAAIYNLFRIPLNFIVLFSLLTDLTPTQSFALNCLMLGTASGMMYILMKRRESTQGIEGGGGGGMENVALISSTSPTKDSVV
jgi:hypothetical protein